MKTIKHLLITIAVLLCSTTTYAYDFEVDGIYYNIISMEDLTVEVTSPYYDNDEYSGEVVIPSTVDYNGNIYSVTSISEYAFYECSSLTNIEIPNSVISIGEFAFENCSSLTSVMFGENSQLTSIGYAAFRGCTSLTSIEIPNSVTTIRGGAFYNCDSLTSIEIPDSVISIESPDYSSYSPCGAFGSCSNLKTVKFGQNSQFNYIGEFAFENCSSLTSVEIPNSVTYIGGGAFRGCTSLTSIEIPDSVISIEGASGFGYDYGAFDFCSNLKTVTFGENSQLTSIGYAAFRGCTSLTSIEIPNSVTTIRGGAFYNCDSLTSIEIPDSVISIEECLHSPLSGYYGAFGSCSNLKTVTFGKNSQLTSIGGGAFYDCDSLTSIEIPSGVISIKSHHIGVFGECSNLKIVTFNENSQLTSIGRYAFGGCSSLTSIEIPNSVTSIGDHAFQGCTLLKDLRMEDGYTTLELGYCLFLFCALETIYWGRNISYDNSENPEDLLFDDMITLKSLTVGSNVTEIPGKTFYDCTNLESVYMRGVPPIISDDTFSNTSFYIATLYVPEGTLAFYQTANIWKNFWNIQEYEPTSIADEVNFTITSNGISFSNADNTTICIYTINGILVEKIDKYTGEDIFLDKGIYIVSVGNKTMKIML